MDYGCQVMAIAHMAFKPGDLKKQPLPLKLNGRSVNVVW